MFDYKSINFLEITAYVSDRYKYKERERSCEKCQYLQGIFNKYFRN